jgi:hypothetical protein
MGWFFQSFPVLPTSSPAILVLRCALAMNSAGPQIANFKIRFQSLAFSFAGRMVANRQKATSSMHGATFSVN